MTDVHPSTLMANRKRLGARVRELRLSKQVSGNELAALVEFSQPKVSRIENGRVTPTARDIAAIAEALRLAPAERDELVSEARLVEDINRSLRRARLEGGLEDIQRDHLEAEAVYSHFLDFAVSMLPGLIQTPDYARAAIRAALPDVPQEELARGVARRIERQGILSDETRTFVFLLAESALHYRYASLAEHRVQLEHLRALAERKNVSVRILSTDVRLPAPMMHGFTIYDDSRVSVELVHTEVFVADPSDIRFYRAQFDTLLAAALPEAESRTWFHAAIRT